MSYSMITLRRDWAGGDPRPHLGDRSAFVRRRRKIWLIHGFNNSEAEARLSMSAFARGLAYYRRNINDEIAHIFWPGDARMPYLRAVAYPSCLKKALACSSELASFFNAEMDDVGKPTELVLIAHSMGCRLAIEAIDRLYGMEGNRARRISVFFFAPAIPTAVIADLLKSPRFGNAALSCWIFHSAADVILRTAFPAGQFLGEIRLGPRQEAVGLHGNPQDLWGDQSHHMHGFGHSDYWRSGELEETLATALGLTGGTYRLRRRTLRSRELPSRVVL